MTVNFRSNNKLAPKYYGPYLIIRKVGAVAYTLQLPASSKIHPIFHVSLLKKHHGVPPATMDESIPLEYDPASTFERTPADVLEIMTMKRKNVAVVQWLILWQHQAREEATWEDASVIMKKYPSFGPWGQGSLNRGSVDAMLLHKRRAQEDKVVGKMTVKLVEETSEEKVAQYKGNNMLTDGKTVSVGDKNDSTPGTI